jgi:hypothetical protein
MKCSHSTCFEVDNNLAWCRTREDAYYTSPVKERQAGKGVGKVAG